MALDRWLALIILLIALIYGFSAFNYPLLPFERNLPVLPNTLPKGLSVLCVLVALIIVLSPRGPDPTANSDQSDAQPLQWVPTAGLVAAMVLYALLLRPIGFLLATVLFLVGTAGILGERRWQVLIPVSLLAAFGIWLLVQQALGIYLKPWPAGL